MEEIPALFNHILSLPGLLQFTNMPTYTMLSLDCKSSYVFLLDVGTRTGASLKLIYFRLCLDGISVSS